MSLHRVLLIFAVSAVLLSGGIGGWPARGGTVPARVDEPPVPPTAQENKPPVPPTAREDKPPGAGEDPPQGASAAQEREEPVPAPTPDGKTSDDELFRDLTGDKRKSEAGADNLLERIEQKMRTAGTRIAAQDAGEKTREVQQDVVSDLEDLIEQARKQKSRQMRMRLPQNNQDQQPDEQQTTEQQAGGEPGGQNQQGPAAESSRREKTEPPPGGDLLMQSRLVKDVWGHLPPAVRQQLLNGFGEKTLPRYEDLVRRYFEALAEEGRSGK